MNEHLVPPLLLAWSSRIRGEAAVESLSDLHPVFRVVAPGGAFILKEAGRITPGQDVERKLAAEYDLLCYLNDCGVPVAVPLITDDGQHYHQGGDSLYVLLPLLSNAPGESGDPRRIFTNIGAAIARLHRALAAYTGPIYSWTMDLPPRILDEAVPLLLRNSTGEEKESLNRLIDDLRGLLAAHLSGLPTQYIHGDCHSGNVLRVGDRVTGFIDLDHLPYGPRIYDLCYHLTGEGMGMFRDPAAADRWFDILIPSLFGGYEQEILLTSAEKDAVPYMMIGICLILASWFVEPLKVPNMVEENLALTRWIYENRERVRAAVGEKR